MHFIEFYDPYTFKTVAFPITQLCKYEYAVSIYDKENDTTTYDYKFFFSGEETFRINVTSAKANELKKWLYNPNSFSLHFLMCEHFATQL